MGEFEQTYTVREAKTYLEPAPEPDKRGSLVTQQQVEQPEPPVIDQRRE